MRHLATLFLKISFYIIIALLAVNCVVYLAVFKPTREKVLREAVDEARLFASVLNPRVIHEIECHTVQYVYQTLSAVHNSGNFKTFSLYGKKGNLIFSTEPVSRKDLILKRVGYVLTSGEESLLFGDNNSKIELFQPLKAKDLGIYGVLCVGIKGLRANDIARRKTAYAMAYASAAVLIVSLFVFLVIKYALRDTAKRISAEIFRLETSDAPAHETDYRGLGYFTQVLFRASNFIKDLKETVGRQNAEIDKLKKTTAKQEEFLKLTYKNFIPNALRNDKVDLEVKYIPYSGGFRDFAFISHFDHFVYLITGSVASDGIESILAISAIDNVVKEWSAARKSPREINYELTKRVKGVGSSANVAAMAAVFDLKTNRLRYFGNSAIPIVLWKKKDESFMILKSQGDTADLSVVESVSAMENSAALSNGDKIVMFNQDLVNVEDKTGKRLGLERLMDILSKNIESSPINLRDIVSLEINRFCEGAGKGDILFMIAEWKGLNPITSFDPIEAAQMK